MNELKCRFIVQVYILIGFCIKFNNAIANKFIEIKNKTLHLRYIQIDNNKDHDWQQFQIVFNLLKSHTEDVEYSNVNCPVNCY